MKKRPMDTGLKYPDSINNVHKVQNDVTKYEDAIRMIHDHGIMIDKRILTATVLAAGLGLTIGVAGIASAQVINNQKDKIQEQNGEITTQNEKLLQYQTESLIDKALEYLEQDRRKEAINTALSSITKYEGTDMPYTAKGRYALAQALRVYDIGNINIDNQEVNEEKTVSQFRCTVRIGEELERFVKPIC